MRRIFGARQEEGQDAARVRRELIMDERVLVISTFELNKVASLTYNELVCDDIFEMIEVIIAQPLRHTPLALSKALVVMKHCLVYGSEKCVNSGYGIAKFVEALRQYNTVLIAQQRQGLGGAISRIKGGGVDKGEPVREAAQKISMLLANIKELQRIRHENASKDSLVPVGSNKVGFITDEVRLLILQKRIEKQNQINLKSNLAKAEGGFGGGYNAANGQSVVGAAHGIEEMMKMAKQQKKKFSDEGTAQVGEPEDERILRELMEESAAMKRAQEAARLEAERERQALEAANAKELDLLSFGTGGFVTTPAPAPAAATTGDLLGGGGTTVKAAAPTADLLGGGGGTVDLLGGMVAAPAKPTAQQPQGSMMDSFLSFAIGTNVNSLQAKTPAPASVAPAPVHDPFSSAVLGPASSTGGDPSVPSISTSVDAFNPAPSVSISQDPTPSAAATDTFGMQNLTLTEPPAAGTTTIPQHTSSIMAPTEDRFAALDALADVGGGGPSQTMGFAMPPMSQPPLPAAAPSSLPPTSMGLGAVATKYGDASHGGDHDDNPWVMGGAVGTGLGDPIAPAPGALPPPPPPG